LAIVYWALRRLGRDRQDAAVVLIGLNTCVYLVFGVIGWSAAAAALVTGLAPPGMTVPWLIGIPVVLAAARWFTAPARIERWTAPAPSAFRRVLGTGVAAAGWARRRVSDPGDRRMFGWAACYWAGDIVSLGAALHAFGGQPALVALVAAYTTGYLVQSLPLPFIAGTGVDAATTFLLHAVGVPLEVALVAVVAHRVFAFWIPILPGCIFAFSLPRSPVLARAPDLDDGESAQSPGDRAASRRLAPGTGG
jgi:uncharacterized membrane protein YbhN (UPF0104 family)